jgi:hypothetical protein
MSTHKIKSFEDFLSSNVLESVKSDAEEVKQEIDFEEMEDVDPEKIAAALSKLIDANGDLDKIDIQEIEENFKQILESEEDNLNESGGIVVTVLEVIGTILGNAALIHFIAAGVSKILGRKVEDSKIAAGLKKIVDLIKNVTGFAGKMIEKFFAWLGKVFGFNPASQKIMGLIGLSIVTIVLLAVGIAYFPAAIAITGTAGVLTLILSVTALIGKAGEITKIISDIIAIVKMEIGNGNKEATSEEIENALHNLESGNLQMA